MIGRYSSRLMRCAALWSLLALVACGDTSVPAANAPEANAAQPINNAALGVSGLGVDSDSVALAAGGNQEPAHSVERDTASVDALMNALTAGISHKPNETPDFDRLRPLFLPEARITLPVVDGQPVVSISFADFEAGNAIPSPQGYLEREIARQTQEYGSIAHVWSTYEVRDRPSDKTPFERGINSWQFVKKDGRWWVLNLVWHIETPTTPLPPRYLTAQE